MESNVEIDQLALQLLYDTGIIQAIKKLRFLEIKLLQVGFSE